MPRDLSGNYTLPSSPFLTGEVADPVPVNTNFNDIAAEITNSLARTETTAFTRSLLNDASALEARATLSAQRAHTLHVRDFGVVGNGAADDTVALQTAINESVTQAAALMFPPGTYRVTDTLVISGKAHLVSMGGAVIRLTRGASHIVPAVHVAPGAANSTFDFIEIDHNADGIAQPSLANQVAFWWTSAVVIGADNTTWRGCIARNAWDSGFAIGRITITGTGLPASPYSGVKGAGLPLATIMSDCRAYSCGLGIHNAFGELGKKGGGFNIGSGSRAQLTNCMTRSCLNGFIIDFGSQAQAVLTNCIADLTLRDPAQPFNGSGIGYYIADGPNVLVGCKSYFAERIGFAVVRFAQSTTMSDCMAYACQQEGFVLSAGGNFTNLTADSCGLAAVNTIDAISIQTDTVAISDLCLVNPRTRGTSHRYGVGCTGASTINASIIGGILNGATAPTFADPAVSHFLGVLGANLGRFGLGTTAPICTGEVRGRTIAGTVGSAAGNMTFAVTDIANANNRLAMGYRQTADEGVIQAVTAGVTVRPLRLNPAGGEVQCGDGNWATGPLRLGAFYLWVDSSGRLRINNGAPGSDTAGTVVGTQT